MLNWQVGPIASLYMRRVALALAAMASRSPRSQADFGAVCRGAGVTLSASQRAELIDQLRSAELIENVVTLDDGDLLVTVTYRGMLTFRGADKRSPSGGPMLQAGDPS